MKTRLFRCRICGDPYIGVAAPSRCPFCGAYEKFVIPAEKWDPEEFNVELSELTRDNLMAALNLELDNTAFYTCASDSARQTGDQYMQAEFKALMKIEREHASAVCKFLKISAPDLPRASCSADAVANSEEGHQREKRAISSYAKFANEAVEPRLKEFFAALVEIESDHLAIHAEQAGGH